MSDTEFSEDFSFQLVKHGSVVSVLLLQYEIYVTKSNIFQIQIDEVIKYLPIGFVTNFKEFVREIIQRGGRFVIKFPTLTRYFIPPDLSNLEDLPYDLVYNTPRSECGPESGPDEVVKECTPLNSILKDSHLQIHSKINEPSLFMLQTIYLNERYPMTVWVLFEDGLFWILLEDKTNPHILPCLYELGTRCSFAKNTDPRLIEKLPFFAWSARIERPLNFSIWWTKTRLVIKESLNYLPENLKYVQNEQLFCKNKTTAAMRILDLTRWIPFEHLILCGFAQGNSAWSAFLLKGIYDPRLLCLIWKFFLYKWEKSL